MVHLDVRQRNVGPRDGHLGMEEGEVLSIAGVVRKLHDVHANVARVPAPAPVVETIRDLRNGDRLIRGLSSLCIEVDDDHVEELSRWPHSAFSLTGDLLVIWDLLNAAVLTRHLPLVEWTLQAASDDLPADGHVGTHVRAVCVHHRDSPCVVIGAEDSEHSSQGMDLLHLALRKVVAVTELVPCIRHPPGVRSGTNEVLLGAEALFLCLGNGFLLHTRCNDHVIAESSCSE
mmetsp:Transcript_8587/g.35795  ORF Transcript_8587/g.35795 Transcript_8587/m.35795 type:complete len:231 (+) Transcript_8587:497-1189(+)